MKDNTTTIIAAAQSISIRGDVAANTRTHLQMIERAAQHQAALICFPELSLTGYEMDLAEELAFTLGDERLNVFSQAAKEQGIIILIGAPARSATGLHIGSFLFYPDGKTDLYTKQFLHLGSEDVFFSAETAQRDVIVHLNEESIFCAICADLTHHEHAAKASASKSSVYFPSALISKNGYATDAAFLQSYASEFQLTVILSNYGAPSGGYDAAGRSAIWSADGTLLHEIDGAGEALLIATKENGSWSARTEN
ncbi:carbon-nitrogen hydrolase family protein [Pedobacter caeni]|uniref:Predicted amidohydrolase n=1 Tax=Pedobacter caeni TaxID=288992 RepID=A0A1M5BPP6_9SPHI|nr:carbon-nitrogen hydrolase family protein [Pedobacter caeni]SHF44553.1 Predicted amidohydrolase [Pedobacter caeni]